MRTKDRDRTALSAASVLRAVAATALLAGPVALAAWGPAPANAAVTVGAAPAVAPAVHDSARATAAQPSDEPPAPAPAAGATRAAAKRPAKAPATAAKPTTAPKVAAPVVAPVQAWHPPMAPPTQVAGAKPASAPVMSTSKPASALPAPAVATKPASAPAAPVAAAKPGPAPVVSVRPAPGPMPVATLKAAGAVPSAPSPTTGGPNALARAGAPGAPARPGVAPAAPASKVVPTTALVAAPVVAAAGAHAPLALAAPAANPATFVGPPIPPGMIVRIGSAAATAPGLAQGPGRATAATAALHPMSVNVKPIAGTPSSLSHLDEHLTYQYNALGRRDPFQPLIGGGFVYANEGGDALPDVGGLKIVGIVWGTDDQFAMAEDARGESMVLRRGDKVMNGVIESLKRDGVVVNLTVDGQSQSVVIPLTKKGEK